MSQFSFDQLEAVRIRNSNTSAQRSPKIGYLKLADGGEALVRFDLKSVADILFATVHKPIYGKKYEGLANEFAPISCLNELGDYSANCPLCKAASENHPVIGKAEKKCYIKMLVAYKDSKSPTGWAEPVPVVWDRPAGFSRELANKLSTFGDLTQVMFKVTRVGSSTDTRYTFDYAIPTVFKPELVPADFSAFENFKVNKHSYWELTREEIEDYLATGAFHIADATTETTEQPAYSAPTQYTQAAPAYTAPAEPAQPQAAQAQPEVKKVSSWDF